MNTDALRIMHILGALADRGRDAFLADFAIHDAIMFNLEVIGEAVNALSPDLRARMPDIPWKKFAGLRDILIHRTFDVDLDAVWEVAETHCPPLSTALRATMTLLAPDE